MEETPTARLPQPRAIDSRAAFVAALQESLSVALAQRARAMFWVDSDFADWPLDDAQWLQQLADWLRLPQRRLVMLAAEPEALRLRSRFMACYGLWTHAIGVRAPAPEDLPGLPCLLLAERTAGLQVMDKRHWRGELCVEPATLRQWSERVDALLQRSEPALPFTILGL
jgi:hypothetical protein